MIYHCLCNKVKVNLLIGLIDVPYIHKSIPVYLSNLYLADASTFFCWWLLMIWVSHQMNGSYKSLVKKNWSRYILVLTTAAVIFCLFRFCKLFISTILDNHIRTMYKYLLFCPISTTCPELWIYLSIIFNPFFILSLSNFRLKS